MSEAKLIVAFVNESRDFAFGFESGRVYEQMKNQNPEIKGVFNYANLEQFKLLAQAMNYSISEINNFSDSEEFSNDFLKIKFVYQQVSSSD